MTAEDIRNHRYEVLSRWSSGWQPTPGDKGLCTRMLADALRMGADMGTAHARRHRVLAYLFRDHLPDKQGAWAISSSDLTPECWFALKDWIKYHKEETTGAWVCDPAFPLQAVDVWQAAEAWIRERRAEVGDVDVVE